MVIKELSLGGPIFKKKRFKVFFRHIRSAKRSFIMVLQYISLYCRSMLRLKKFNELECLGSHYRVIDTIV